MIRCSLVAKTRSSTGRDLLLGGGEAGHLGVGGVGQEQVDALLPQPREGPQVGDPAVERQLVHLEVAGVQHHAGRRADGDGERVGDGVVDRDELQVEGAERDPVALGHDRLHGVLQAVLAQLAVEQGQGQLRAHERDVGALAQQVGHRADVVLVAVGQHQRLDRVEPVPDGVEVGQDQVDAGVVLLGEEHPAVDDEQPPVVLEDGHVAPDLAEPAERDDAQAAAGERGRRGQLGVGVAHRSSAPWRAARSAATSSSSSATRGPRTLRFSSTPSSSRPALAVVAP